MKKLMTFLTLTLLTISCSRFGIGEKPCYAIYCFPPGPSFHLKFKGYDDYEIGSLKVLLLDKNSLKILDSTQIQTYNFKYTMYGSFMEFKNREEFREYSLVLIEPNYDRDTISNMDYDLSQIRGEEICNNCDKTLFKQYSNVKVDFRGKRYSYRDTLIINK